MKLNLLLIKPECIFSIRRSLPLRDRKVEFYQKHYQRQVNRKIVISPMVDNTALPVAENLGIEVYSYAEDVSMD